MKQQFNAVIGRGSKISVCCRILIHVFKFAFRAFERIYFTLARMHARAHTHTHTRAFYDNCL